MALLMTMAALAVPAAAQPPAVLPNRCGHVHPAADARSWLRRYVRSDRPYLDEDRIRHTRRCVASDRRRRALRTLTRKWREWRTGYGPKWRIRFNRLPAWAKGWARSTSQCESGMNQNAVGGGGLYYSYFQWLPSTWYAAGGDRWPTTASWHHQAVLAVNWLNVAPASTQWPVCGV